MAIFAAAMIGWLPNSLFAEDDWDHLGSPLPQLCSATLNRVSADHGGFGITNLPEDFKVPKRSDYAHGGGTQFSSSIKNQCRFGGCWASAALLIPENVAHQKGVDLELSTEFMIITNMLHQVRADAKTYMNKTNSRTGNQYEVRTRDNPAPQAPKKEYLTEGAGVSEAIGTMKKFGLMPKSAWTPKRVFGAKPSQDQRLLSSIRALQREAYRKLDSLFDSYEAITRLYERQVAPVSSPYTAEALIGLLGQLGLGHDFDLDYPVFPPFNELPATKEILQSLDSQVWTALVSYVGEPPTQFEWRGGLETPQSFIKSQLFNDFYFRSLLERPVPKKFNRFDFELIKELVDSKDQLIVSIWSPRFLTDHDEALFSVGAFNPHNLIFADLMEINKVDAEHSSHAIAIVDYIVDDDGNPEWILLKNSWGEESGEAGYYHVDWESFAQIALRLTVPQHYAAN
ncbi:MAG: hypothetical protein HRT45_08455 [Bdellovibrionales bacterium]|nr:hypothetical protein [Bdellovibrionales bacterium]